MRTTVADASDSNLCDIPGVLQLCDGDPRIMGYLNRAIRRLLPRGQWKGTVVRYRICTSSECITWLRQIETVLGFAVCDSPGMIRSHWYEFLGYGPGQIRSSQWRDPNALIDRGLAVAFDDICGEGKKIRVYLDNPADAGKTILLQGYDQYRNWVLTDNGATDGELVTLQAAPTTYVDTDTVWMPAGLVGVQKQVTLGPVRLYELDTATSLQRPLAIYEPDETRPQYRRSFAPGLSRDFACRNNSGSSTCTDKSITVLAKLAFIPVTRSTDYLLIQNLDALEDMVQSVKKRKDGLFAEALAFEASAIATLESELSDFHGDGTIDPVQAINAGIYAGSGVESLL